MMPVIIRFHGGCYASNTVAIIVNVSMPLLAEPKLMSH